ncbi:hypothetical protein JB92DRAFT_3146834, partial [Gautieria morchelliformis]
MQVNNSVVLFTLQHDTRQLASSHPLRCIPAKRICIHGNCIGEYDLPEIVKRSTRNNVGKAYQKCKGCGTIFIHQRMAAFPPNADLALAPPPAPSQQSATPSAAPSATPSVPSAPQPAPLLPNGGCP